MRLFLLKLAVFLISSFLAINFLAALYGRHAQPRFEREQKEVYDALRRAQTSSAAIEVLLGDSVSHQLMAVANVPEACDLTTNQAISLYGQYVLAREALAHDPLAKRLTLAYQPKSFANDLTQEFTFNYVVKPFYVRPSFRADMDQLVKRRLDRRPFYRLVTIPLFHYTDVLSATDYSDSAPQPYFYLSPVSIDYLHRLQRLCSSRGVSLRIVSTPINQARGYDQGTFLQEVSAAKLDDTFAGYTSTIAYVDPDLLIDGTHFKSAYIPENSAKFVKMLGL